MDFKKINLDNRSGEEHRQKYFDSILDLIDREADNARKIRDRDCSPEAMAQNREAYREAFAKMLGWPLAEYVHNYDPNIRKELVTETEELKVYRLCIETLPGVWFEGMVYEPANREEKAPFAVINPGATYCVEDLIAHGDYSCEQYQNIGGRALEKGIVLFAPQFLLWPGIEPQPRQLLDAKLKALGGSIAALEIFNVRRAIDYFVAKEPIDPERIGMIGLSYGGFYTLYISAAETRIKSVFSSCFFCDRFSAKAEPTGTRSDWLWQNSANLFFDAEVAGLIAPRALYIENGEVDELFPIESVRTEADRLRPFYQAANAQDNLLLHIGPNGHSVCPGEKGFSFFVDHLL